MKYRTLFIVLFFLFTTSCQTALKKQVNLNEVEAATFKGYVSVKDLKKNKSYLVNFKSQVYKYKYLRLDVTAPFIGHIASLSVLGDQLQYIIPAKKKYYSGPGNARHLKSILPIELESSVLLHLFWGTPIQRPGWTCLGDALLPSRCQLKKERVTVNWERSSSGVASKIKITHPLAHIEFYVDNFIVQKPPFDFKKYQLPMP